MGKNHKGNPKNKDLGRILIKEKKSAGRNRNHAKGEDSWRHTSELQDGDDWNRINLQSVTEKDSLDEFLDTAAMAGLEFTAEKMNIKVVGTEERTGVLGEAEKTRIKTKQNVHKQLIRIPRRPTWDETTTPEELATQEKQTFLDWRRSLALLQEKEQLLLTPYEKNLDVWRQLWRVIERCDVVCQIVDARNPLLYKCDDLEKYVHESNPNKEFIVLVNKADYLTDNQRMCWFEYFKERGMKVVFWSALDATVDDPLDDIEEEEDDDDTDADEDDDVQSEDLEEGDDDEEQDDDGDDDDDDGDRIEDDKETGNVDGEMDQGGDEIEIKNIETKDANMNCIDETSSNKLFNRAEILSQRELLDYFRSFERIDPECSHVMIGLVGYPNVGKSSTINALLQGKKTAVSSTPGKTKHFQTHFIDEALCLCDCPGLVFPSFVFTKADLVLNGILPVDQLRDHIPPLELMLQQIPVNVLESTYGININVSDQRAVLENIALGKQVLPSGEDFAGSYARMRGFMTSSGQPDCPRASRYIIKDYLKGKLLYCMPPPGTHGSTFEASQVSTKVLARLQAKEEKKLCEGRAKPFAGMEEFDDEFFAEKQKHSRHSKAPVMGVDAASDEALLKERMLQKPWKKHNNRNKKEKLRRVFKD